MNAPGLNIPKPPQSRIPIPKPFPKLPEPFDPLAWLMALINMLMGIIKPILEGILLSDQNRDRHYYLYLERYHDAHHVTRISSVSTICT